jgi:hypothetical protein
MPTTLDDVDAAKESCLDAYDTKLVNARQMLNASTVPADQASILAEIRTLRSQRTDILMQDYIGELTDPAMTAALGKITQATNDMNAVAPVMTSVTGFIASLASFFSAAGKVIPALKGL